MAFRKPPNDTIMKYSVIDLIEQISVNVQLKSNVTFTSLVLIINDIANTLQIAKAIIKITFLIF